MPYFCTQCGESSEFERVDVVIRIEEQAIEETRYLDSDGGVVDYESGDLIDSDITSEETDSEGTVRCSNCMAIAEVLDEDEIEELMETNEFKKKNEEDKSEPVDFAQVI